jgi:hypothetical protein
MLNVSGSFSGSIRTQSTISVDDQPNHSVGVAEICGTQSSSDANWNNSTITYWGTIDMQGTEGIQRGYFVNDHGPRGKDRGTFEGNASVVAGQVVVEGKWRRHVQDQAHVTDHRRSDVARRVRARRSGGRVASSQVFARSRFARREQLMSDEIIEQRLGGD